MPRIRWAAALALLAAPLPVQAQELTAGSEYRVDAARSEIVWEVDASFRSVRSRTRKMGGTAKVVSVGEDGAELEGRLEIESASFDTGNPRRDRTLHEKSLASEEHPSIVFVPRRIYRTSSWAEEEVLALEGDLSIRGVTKPVRIPVTLRRRGARLVVAGSTRLQWAEYGVPDPSSFLSKVRPDVQIEAHLELVPGP
jgi:polyisoprenoid-binding protein YceI